MFAEKNLNLLNPLDPPQKLKQRPTKELAVGFSTFIATQADK